MNVAPATCAVPQEPPVRAAASRDLPALAALLRAEAEYAQRLAGYFQLREDFDWPAFTAAKLNEPDRAVLVAEHAGRPAGFIELRIRRYAAPLRHPSWFGRWVSLRRLAGRRPSPPGVPIAALSLGTIESCYVDEPYRNRGLGSALARAGIAWLREAGMCRVELGVLANNTALTFWERLGFRAYRISMAADIGHGATTDIER